MRQLIALAALGWACVRVKEVEVCSTDAGPAGVNLCGNSVVDPGEQCDDGNPRNGDGCSNQCQREARPECGNGVLEGGEACDDGNGVDDDACGNDCELTADNNDSWESAADGRFGGQVVDAIFPAGDQDYFRFEGEQGQWLIITTDANADADDKLVDTVIALMRADEIAQNDNYDDGEADSRIVTRLPATDTYYLKVQDNRMAASGLLGVLELCVHAEDPRAGDRRGAGEPDAEAGDDAESAQAGLVGRYHYAWVVGGFERSGDVDTYAFSIPSEEAGDKTQFDMNIYKASPSGNGSTRPVRVWIAIPTAPWWLAGPRQRLRHLRPESGSGRLHLVEHPGGEAGPTTSTSCWCTGTATTTPSRRRRRTDRSGNWARFALPKRLAVAFALARPMEASTIFAWICRRTNASRWCRARSAGSGVVDLTVSVDGNDEELSATIEDSSSVPSGRKPRANGRGGLCALEQGGATRRRRRAFRALQGCSRNR